MGKPSCFFLGLLDNVGTCWKTKFFFWENHSEMFDNVGKSENVWIFMLKMFDPQAHEISFKLIYIHILSEIELTGVVLTPKKHRPLISYQSIVTSSSSDGAN